MIISKKIQVSIAIFLPILNTIASVTQNYFDGFGTGHIRILIILLFIVFAFHKFYQNTLINFIIIINLVYLFILALFATDLSYTFSILVKYGISTLLFTIGYYYIKNLEEYKRLLKAYVFILFIITFSILIANIFHLGSSDYTSETSFYYGVARVDITMSMAVLILAVSPIFLLITNKKRQIYIVVILLISFIIVLLGMKRTAIASLILGYIIYMFISHISIKQIGKYIGISFILLLFSPLFFNTLYTRYLSRQEAGRFDIDQAQGEEARFMEVNNVINDFINGDIGHKLFGSELFNYKEFANVERMLHTDYTTMLHGSGLIGIFIFIFIYLLIFKKVNFYRKFFKKNKLMISVVATSFSLLVVALILGIGSTVHGIGVRAYIFLFLGASLGVLNSHYNYIKKGKK